MKFSFVNITKSKWQHAGQKPIAIVYQWINVAMGESFDVPALRLSSVGVRIYIHCDRVPPQHHNINLAAKMNVNKSNRKQVMQQQEKPSRSKAQGQNEFTNEGMIPDRRFTRLISFRSNNSINSLKRLEAFRLK